MHSIFSSLLGIDSNIELVNDNTIEAAIKLMTNLGAEFERRI